MNKSAVVKFESFRCKPVELVLGDSFSFQWSGKDEEGEYVMYNNLAELVEHEGELKICWNGHKMDPLHFLRCDHLDGDISMDAIGKTHNDITGVRY